jgi:HK97 family phage major capsid protein
MKVTVWVALGCGAQAGPGALGWAGPGLLARGEGTLPSWRREFPAKTPAKCWGKSVLLVMNSLERVAEINAIAGALTGRVQDIDTLAARAIAENWSVERFRGEIMGRLPRVGPMRPLDIPARELERFSLSKAIAEVADRGGLSGLEAEVNQECSRTYQKPKGSFWLPYEALAVRDLQLVATNTLGGYLKGTDLLASEFIEMLRNRAIVLRMGARTLTGLVGDVAIPKQVTGATAQWASSELASVTASFAQFGQLSMSPKECIAKVTISKKLITQATPSVEQLIRDDVARQIALAIDLAALHGAGSGGEPQGIYAASSNLITLATNGAALSTSNARAAMVSLEAAVGVANVDLGRCAFVTNSKVKSALRLAENSSGSGEFVWGDTPRPDAPGDGAILGYRASVTNQVRSDLTQGTATGICSPVFFGDWSELLLGLWGAGLDILVDAYSDASTRKINIYGTQYCDVGLRHPAGIAVLKGVIA